MDAKITGSFIAQLRKQRGLTQKELAEKLEVTDKAISRWETGKGMPETSLLKPLAEILGVSVGELLAGKMLEVSQIKEQTDKILLESLDEPDDEAQLRRILRYVFIGVIVAMGGLYFAMLMDSLFNGTETFVGGIGMYLCIVVVTCTGIILTRMDRN